MIDDLRARKIAEDFIEAQNSRFKYEFVGIVRIPRFPSEVNVNFEVSEPDGTKFDGPVVVVVDEPTETASFFQ